MESVNWQPDILGDGFEMAFINHPADYSGKVRSTVIRKLATAPSHKAILYVQDSVIISYKRRWHRCLLIMDITFMPLT